MGYGSFVALLENPSSSVHGWIKVVTNFLIAPEPDKDFRLVRYQRLVIHLVDLVRTLDQGRLPRDLEAAAHRYLKVVDRTGGDNRVNHDQKQV
jgi:hypothetical protein